MKAMGFIINEADRKEFNKKERKLLTKFERSLLSRRLKRWKIEINDNDLDEIINIYNHLIDFCLEQRDEPNHYRFGFVVLPRSFYEIDDRDFFSVFIKLISMQKHHLLHFLDYALLTNNDCTFGLTSLESFISSFLHAYYRYGDLENFYESFVDNNEYLIEYIIDGNIVDIIDSKYVNQEYKDIMKIYDDIRRIYFEKDYDTLDEESYFEHFFNMTYHYFLINNLFNTNPSDVLDYLNYVKDNIPIIYEKISLVGEMDNKEMINYIDSLYHNSKNKVKIIK